MKTYDTPYPMQRIESFMHYTVYNGHTTLSLLRHTRIRKVFGYNMSSNSLYHAKRELPSWSWFRTARTKRASRSTSLLKAERAQAEVLDCSTKTSTLHQTLRQNVKPILHGYHAKPSFHPQIHNHPLHYIMRNRHCHQYCTRSQSQISCLW